jgi:hypothetical protein
MAVGKTFDCVEMKDRIQRDLLREFEARRLEFDSYVDFINATAEEDLDTKAWRKRVRLARLAVKS